VASPGVYQMGVTAEGNTYATGTWLADDITPPEYYFGIGTETMNLAGDIMTFYSIPVGYYQFTLNGVTNGIPFVPAPLVVRPGLTSFGPGAFSASGDVQLSFPVTLMEYQYILFFQVTGDTINLQIDCTFFELMNAPTQECFWSALITAVPATFSI